MGHSSLSLGLSRQHRNGADKVPAWCSWQSVRICPLSYFVIYLFYLFFYQNGQMDRYVCRFIYVMRTGGRATHGRVYTYLSICPFVRLSFFYSILQTKISGHFRTDSVSFWPLPPPGVAQSCPSTPVSDRCRDATCRCCGPRQCLFYSGVARTTWRKCSTGCLCFRHTRCRKPHADHLPPPAERIWRGCSDVSPAGSTR